MSSTIVLFVVGAGAPTLTLTRVERTLLGGIELKLVGLTTLWSNRAGKVSELHHFVVRHGDGVKYYRPTLLFGQEGLLCA